MPKKSLAFLIACTDNLTFAAGNVALSLNKYLRDIEYECVVIHRPISARDESVLREIPNVRMLPFDFSAEFIEVMMARMPGASRFRAGNALMTFTHFEVFRLLDEYRVVAWLDTDISIQADISNIVDFAPFGITADTPFSVTNNFSRQIDGYDLSVPGYCAAVIVADDSLPYRAIYEWCYSKSMEHADALVNADQGILNLALQEFSISPKIMPLDVWQCRPDRPTAIQAKIVHFGHKRKVWNDEVISHAYPEWYRMHKVWQKRGGSDFPRPFEPASVMGMLDNMKRMSDPSTPLGGSSSHLSDASARLAAIENSLTWRATRPIRSFIGKFPRLRRNIYRAARISYWIASGKLLQRYKAWRDARVAAAAGIPLEAYSKPETAETVVAHVVDLYRSGGEQAAVYYMRKAVAHELNARAWRLDVVFRILDAWPDSLAALESASVARPSEPDFHDLAGLIYIERRKLDEAIFHFEKSVAVAPDRVVARINLVAALLFKGKCAESVEAARATMMLTEEFYVYLLLASALAKRDGNVGEATKVLERGLGLGTGRHAIGEREDLREKTVLLKLTMGAGDIIIALPVIEHLEKRGARVLLHVESARDRTLERLLSCCPGVSGIVAPGEVAPAHDYYIELYRQFLSAGAPVMGQPWIFPPNELVTAWKNRLRPVPGFKVGIVWAGDSQPSWRGFRILSHVQRCCPAAMFAALERIPGVSLVSLQKGPPSAEAKDCGASVVDLATEIKDYTDTAAIIENLDLVISVDTSVAHLAGAMGKPVWTLLHYDSIFFFWDKEESSSWYPTARLFRQQRPGDWDGIFASVAQALQQEVGQTSSRLVGKSALKAPAFGRLAGSRQEAMR